MGLIQPKKNKNLNRELKFRTTRVRVFAWLGKDTSSVPCFAFVNEIKKKGMLVFASRKLPLGDVVMIAFEQENAQPFRAKVLGNTSKVDKKNLPTADYNWRTAIEFEFASEAEAKRYLEFWVMLRTRTAEQALDVKQQAYKVIDGKGDGDLDLDDSLSDLNIGDGNDDSGKKGAA